MYPLVDMLLFCYMTNKFFFFFFSSVAVGLYLEWASMLQHQ